MKTVFNQIEGLFSKVDKEPTGKKNFFITKLEKEKYESFIMHSLQCYKAASYHRDNLIQKIAESKKEFEKKFKPSPPKRITTVKYTKDENEIAFELFAFVASLKSSYDFLLNATQSHFLINAKAKAIGIGDVIKFIADKKNKSMKDNSTSEFLLENLTNLSYINDYRNTLLHRSTLRFKVSYELLKNEFGEVTNSFPIAMPIRPIDSTDFIKHTREEIAHMGHLDDHNIDTSEEKVTVSYSDGSTKLISHKITRTPSTGYIEIDRFMNDQIEVFETFLKKYIDSLKF